MILLHTPSNEFVQQTYGSGAHDLFTASTNRVGGGD